MSSINKISPHPSARHQTAIPRVPQGDTGSKSPLISSWQRDYTDLSSDWIPEGNAGSAVSQLLGSLKEKYPELDIFITDSLDKDSLRSLAASLGEGSYLLISKEYLEKMETGKEAFEKGKSVIIRLLTQLSGQKDSHMAQGFYIGRDEALSWTADLPVEKPVREGPSFSAASKENSFSGQTDFYEKYGLKSKKVSLSIISSSYMSLAGARTKGQVQTVMGQVQRNISSLRLSSCFGDTQERMKARAAISSMQKLLQRGSRKIRRLNEEELTQLRQKRARKQQDQEKELKLLLARRKMQARRRSADEMIRKEGQLDELNQSFRFRQYNKYSRELEYQMPPSIPAPSLPVDSSIAQDASAPALSAADISISSVAV